MRRVGFNDETDPPLKCAECGNPIGRSPYKVGGWELEYARLYGRATGLCDLCVRELAEEVSKVAGAIRSALAAPSQKERGTATGRPDLEAPDLEAVLADPSSQKA
jgi:hypothetical protein